MGVNREWRCIGHDLAFESTEDKPLCPAGCSNKFVVQEFRTAPSIRSGGTRVMDTMTRQLASDYNMTDMRNDKDGSSVMASTRTESGGTRVVGNPNRQAYWNRGLFPVKEGWAQRGEAAPVFNPKSAGIVDGGIPVNQIRDAAGNHLRNATRIIKPGQKT